jgi:F-type H+-transporting ATPase subunit b
MKTLVFKYGKPVMIWLFCGILLLTATDALAAESSNGWRPTYDLVMRWLNFGILILLFFKYARKPLSAFLNGKSRQIKVSIKRVEEEKDVLKTRIQELLNERKEGRKHLEQIRDRFIAQGERKKQKIIDDAKKESRLLLESAQRKVAHEMASARDRLKIEMVDQAIELAMQKLPQLMTDEDTQQSLKTYLDGIHSLSKP